MTDSVPQLLQLPDACLLAVLQCCADDPRSLFSAARAHSRLHQAAVLAASSVTVVRNRQQRLDNVLLYLANNGEHVGSIEFGSVWGAWLIPSKDHTSAAAAQQAAGAFQPVMQHVGLAVAAWKWVP